MLMCWEDELRFSENKDEGPFLTLEKHSRVPILLNKHKNMLVQTPYNSTAGLLTTGNSCSMLISLVSLLTATNRAQREVEKPKFKPDTVANP